MRFILMAFILFTIPVYATDNPDSPDYLGEFEKRIEPYYTGIHDARTTYDYIDGYSALEKALEKELVDAYDLLLNNLPKEQRQLLITSQMQWQEYRDSENLLIEGVWTQESYGTSSGLTRGKLRCSIIRSRVEGLIARLASM